jgi:hypothetical protein
MGLREKQINQQSGLLTLAYALIATQTFSRIDSGHYTLGSGAAITVTLPVPKAGPSDQGGDDGKILMFTTATAHAHIVNSTALAFNGNNDTATSSAAIGNFLMLVANGGVWYVCSNLNFTLSEV